MENQENNRPVLYKQLNKIEEQLTLIIAAINGNPMNDDDAGIVGDIDQIRKNMKDIQERLRPLEKFKDRLYWTWLLIMAGSGVVGSVCGLTISYFSLKK